MGREDVDMSDFLDGAAMKARDHARLPMHVRLSFDVPNEIKLNPFGSVGCLCKRGLHQRHPMDARQRRLQGVERCRSGW